jgi:hypothetical protein
MSIELLVLVYVTFKRHKGLYFWSIIITTLGIILQTTGYILKEFQNTCPPILTTIICKAGWVSNVSGFSLVLWSRLHLIVNEPRILKAVLCMIIIDGILCHTPIIVFEFGLIYDHSVYYRPMEIMERIQQTVFTLQETAISSLYIYHTARFLRSGYGVRTRKLITLLVCVQILVVALDAMLTVFDYTNKFTLKCTIHPFVYSVKLKLEFIVLNQLQTLVKRGMTLGLSLGSIPKADSGSETVSATPSPPAGSAMPSGLESKTRTLEGDFITKAGVAKVDSYRGSGSSVVKDARIGIEEEGSSHAKRKASEMTLEGDEVDLKDVVGQGDGGGRETVDDIERLYLGRYVVDEDEIKEWSG